MSMSLHLLQHILEEITEEGEPLETPTLTTDETIEAKRRMRKRSVN